MCLSKRVKWEFGISLNQAGLVENENSAEYIDSVDYNVHHGRASLLEELSKEIETKSWVSSSVTM